MRDFRELKVWQRAHQLTLAAYNATGTFPREEIYGLTSQIRRGCASIPANIAEGSGRGTDAEMARYLQIALASGSELEYHLLLARDLGYLGDPRYMALSSELVEVKRMLNSFIRKLKANG